MSETKSGKSREERMDLCSLFDFFYNRRIIPSTPRGGCFRNTHLAVN